MAVSGLIECLPLRLLLILQRVIHRADYHTVLFEETQRWVTTITLNAKVKSVDSDTTAMLLEDGRKIEADVIVSVDGKFV